MRGRKKKIITNLLLSLLAVSLVSCSSSSEQKAEKKVSLEPNSNDPLQPLMAKTQANLRYLIYGLLNFDQVKLEKSTKNLITLSQYMAKSALPQHQSYMDEWEALCEKQQHTVEDIRQQFLEKNHEQATAAFGDLVANCVRCHELFRFGKKGKPKITH